jgi:hypothetical protein
MRDVRTNAHALIDSHGRDAVGEALLRALRCKMTGDAAGQGHWVEVIVVIMEIQGPARPRKSRRRDL